MASIINIRFINKLSYAYSRHFKKYGASLSFANPMLVKLLIPQQHPNQWCFITAPAIRINEELKQHSVKYYMACGASLLLGAALVSHGTVKADTKKDLSQQVLLQQADDFYTLNQFNDIYELLQPHKDSRSDEVLWRLSRAAYELAKAAPDAPARAARLREAFAYVQEALAINTDNYAVHKWMAILVDEVAALDGSKSRILQSFVMKEHMEKACELNPTDGTSWYLLGMWHYNIAGIAWYQRKAAALLFATPPNSTYEEALKVFLHAEKVEPNFYSQNLLMIGKCYQQLHQRDSAVQYLRLARDYCSRSDRTSPPTQDDKDAATEAIKLLAQLGDKLEEIVQSK